jgi:hypothetical protein
MEESRFEETGHPDRPPIPAGAGVAARKAFGIRSKFEFTIGREDPAVILAKETR